MIERDGNRIEIICDGEGCTEGLGRSYAKDEFDVMIDDAKSASWRITRVNGRWLHHCADCATAYRY